MVKVCLIGTDYAINQERKDNKSYGGVTYYRLIKPMIGNNTEKYSFTYHGADLLQEAEGKTTEQFWLDFVGRYDIFITKHIDNPEAASNLLFFAQREGKKVILDFDDNLFEIRSDQPAYELYKPGSEKRAYVSALLSMVDGLFVSTEPLAYYYKNYLKKVFDIEMPIFVLPNFNDASDWDFKPVEKDPNKIVIGWMGSTTHMADLKIPLKAIQRILKEYPNVEFNILGGLSHKEAVELFEDVDDSVLGRVFVNGGTQSWEGYPELLSQQPWDIGIAPLVKDVFNEGKSHIKWMEYAMYKIPTIASNVYPYNTTIKHGETGIIADDNQWYNSLKTLVRNAELRKTIGKNAYNHVKNNLQYKNHKHMWIEALSNFI